MLSSLDTVGSLNDETLLWPGKETVFLYGLFHTLSYNQSFIQLLFVLCFSLFIFYSGIVINPG